MLLWLVCGMVRMGPSPSYSGNAVAAGSAEGGSVQHEM